MTDRELLEMAAKAAGIGIVGPIEKYIAQPSIEHIGGFIIDNDRGGNSCWNPLSDDGDALRLAVKLELTVNISHGKTVVDTPWGPVIDFESCGDTCAATRRAIVLAAAEIWKSS